LVSRTRVGVTRQQDASVQRGIAWRTRERDTRPYAKDRYQPPPESRSALPATESLTCSAVFAGGKGKLATVEFLREGREVFSGDFELPLPVTAVGPFLRPAPRLQGGSWVCRWSLAGRVLATKRFRIA
jgi:hypothetical protein